MKCILATMLVLVAVALGRPEPPSPRLNNQYLSPGYSTTHQDRFSPPPSPGQHSSNSISVESARSQYSAPSNQYSAPSSQYSAPSRQYSAPSSQYSAPSSQYGAPSTQYSAPSSQYGAPSTQYSAPSSQYGAPSTPSNQYGAPARSSHSNSRASQSRTPAQPRITAAPARSYGAPAQTAAVFLSAQPAAQYGAPSTSYDSAASGYSYEKNTVDDDLAEPANYEFSYEVQDAPTGGEFAHRESRQGDVTRGSYEVLLPDGRKQIVEYEADQDGYRPTIRYEEPQAGYADANSGPY